VVQIPDADEQLAFAVDASFESVEPVAPTETESLDEETR
jgi:hypothetical protein